MKTIKNLAVTTLTTPSDAQDAFLIISGTGERADYADKIGYGQLSDWLTGALTGRMGSAEALLAQLQAALAALSSGTGGLTYTADDRARLVPSGTIVMWSGAPSAVPAGWFICDGANGTPDLRGRFIVGAGPTFAQNSTGGNSGAGAIAFTVSAAGSHQHPIHATIDPAATGVAYNYTTYSTYAGGGTQVAVAAGHNGAPPTLTDPTHAHTMSGSTDAIGDHTHSVTGDASQILPPYYALAYIIKT